MRILAPDLPGHGATRVEPVDIPTTIAALGRFLSGFEPPVPLMGYSQGGRIALLTAIEHPDLVDRLVLVSSSPGIPDAAARRARRSHDETLADRIEAIGFAAFLDEWLTGPVAGTAHLDEGLRHRDRTVREENTADGLASALRGLGQGVQPYVGDRISELHMPVLTVSGADDTAYSLLASGMAAEAPNGRHVRIPGAGHNVILDRPDEVRRVVSKFLADGSTTG